MDDGMEGDFSQVYNGNGYPNVLSYTTSSLTTGLSYRFYVTAFNSVGEGLGTDVESFYSCIAPTCLAAPTPGTITTSSV
jgi:hypothetical protein